MSVNQGFSKSLTPCSTVTLSSR